MGQAYSSAPLAGPSASSSLARIDVQIADLPGGLLGQALGNTIILDRDAASYGWFVDATPWSSAEFADESSAVVTKDVASPAGRMDLLTAVAHEIGHVLGFDDEHADPNSDSLMTG